MSDTPKRILLLDGMPGGALPIKALFDGGRVQGCTVTYAKDLPTAIHWLGQDAHDVVLVGSEAMRGIGLRGMADLRVAAKAAPIVVLPADGEMETARRALELASRGAAPDGGGDGNRRETGRRTARRRRTGRGRGARARARPA